MILDQDDLAINLHLVGSVSTLTNDDKVLWHHMTVLAKISEYTVFRFCIALFVLFCFVWKKRVNLELKFNIKEAMEIPQLLQSNVV